YVNGVQLSALTMSQLSYLAGERCPAAGGGRTSKQEWVAAKCSTSLVDACAGSPSGRASLWCHVRALRTSGSFAGTRTHWCALHVRAILRHCVRFAPQ